MSRGRTEVEVPFGVVPVFNFTNETGVSITLALECSPQEYLINHGEKVQVFIEDEVGNFPLDISLTKDCLQIYPKASWGNWYVYKDGVDISTMNRSGSRE